MERNYKRILGNYREKLRFNHSDDMQELVIGKPGAFFGDGGCLS